MAIVRYNLEQRVLIYDGYVGVGGNPHTNRAGENSVVNFPI
jgi:hypothetical protein